ncbi:MAG TPA: hypothetical protein VEC19_18230 [Usitatibacter sp.]|nr:hypothetical protein [Usitatibacter sp.]
MKRIALAAGLLAGASVSTALGQAPADVPRHKCEPIPQMPAKSLMADRMVRRTFDNDLKLYKECMNGYLDQRNAAIKANQDAANAAINEYNGVMKSLADAQDSQKGGDAAPKTSGGSTKY